MTIINLRRLLTFLLFSSAMPLADEKAVLRLAVSHSRAPQSRFSSALVSGEMSGSEEVGTGRLLLREPISHPEAPPGERRDGLMRLGHM